MGKSKKVASKDLDWSEVEQPRPVVLVPEVRVGVPAPKSFSGSGESVEEIAGEYTVWKVQLNNYMQALRAEGAKMSPEVELYRKIACLSGHAVLVAQDVIDEFAAGGQNENATVRWTDIEKRLDSIFLGAVNPQSVIATLHAIKQAPGQSVSDYAAKWNAVHRRLVSIGVSNRDVAAQWFMQGLQSSLKVRVSEKLLEDQPLIKFAVNDAAGAVACVTNLAMAREQAMKLRRSDDEGERRWRSGGRTWRQSVSNSRTSGIAAQVNSMATDFATMLGIDNTTVQQRLKAKECLNCGSNAHHMRACPKLRQARINSLDVEPNETYVRPKNE